jgi:hypothetical protein
MVIAAGIALPIVRINDGKDACALSHDKVVW